MVKDDFFCFCLSCSCSFLSFFFVVLVIIPFLFFFFFCSFAKVGNSREKPFYLPVSVGPDDHVFVTGISFISLGRSSFIGRQLFRVDVTLFSFFLFGVNFVVV